MDDTIYIHNFAVAGRPVPTYIVSVLFITPSAIVLVVITSTINRRKTGSRWRVSLRWLMVYVVLIGIGFGGWFSFVEWINQLMFDAFTVDISIEAADEFE